MPTTASVRLDPAARRAATWCDRAAWVAALLLAAAALGAARGDDHAMTLARPTAAQRAWQDLELGVFIHFMPSTWGDGFPYDLSRINPEKLDTDQWVRCAEAMGAKYIVFVAKHGPGFCYWQTDTTPYGVKQLAWRDGKGDILGDLAASCRRRGMTLGVYLTAWDGYWGASQGGIIGAAEAGERYRRLHGQELEVTPEAQERYNATYRQQLTEVLTRYGAIAEVWWDGGIQVPVLDIMQQHAPQAVTFGSPGDQPFPNPIRWCGNEDGWANYPLWNPRSTAASAQYSPTNPEFVGDPRGPQWFPTECDTTMRYGPPGYPSKWGWEPDQEQLVRSLDHLMEVYYQSVGRGANLLLNLTPDPSGRIPEADAQRAAEFGAEIKRRFGHPLAETKGEGEATELDLGRPTLLDHVVTMEDIARGQRVLKYVVEGCRYGAWMPLAEGSSIGHKKIDRFDQVEVSKVRLRVTESLAPPLIRSLAAYNVSDTGPLDPAGRPRIVKIGTVDCDMVETTPVVFQGRLYRFEYVRSNYWRNRTGQSYFRFVDRETGRATPAFAQGYVFGSAFVDGDRVYVTGTSTEAGWTGQRVQMFASRDLRQWETWTALDLPGWGICNTSVCRADGEYVMMFEIHLPADQAGVPFTARFAKSRDLRHWELTPPECVYAKDRYTAPHCLRYLDGWFYDFYLEAYNGYETRVVRSRDLVHWEPGPLNPVLAASDTDRRLADPKLPARLRRRIAEAQDLNNSDIDFCEVNGRVLITYSWGNQLGVEHLAEAVFDGTEEQFLRAWFPEAEAR